MISVLQVLHVFCENYLCATLRHKKGCLVIFSSMVNEKKRDNSQVRVNIVALPLEKYILSFL